MPKKRVKKLNVRKDGYGGFVHNKPIGDVRTKNRVQKRRPGSRSGSVDQSPRGW